jgi:hypothetical protein
MRALNGRPSDRSITLSCVAVRRVFPIGLVLLSNRNQQSSL